MGLRITVIGLGYLGVTHAVAMVEFGHEVLGIEPDSIKLESLKQGKVPFFEPGLQDALERALTTGRLHFSPSHTDFSKTADVHFLCVGTPQESNGFKANTDFVFSAAKEVAPVVSETAIVVGKSTVPVGTAEKLQQLLNDIAGFDVSLAWNPEFLREGTALEDSRHPDRIVVGSRNANTFTVLRNVYQPAIDAGSPFIEMDIETSELVKVAANSFLATKISFINAMAEIAEVTGADTVKLAEAIGYDERIGNKFLKTGIGFGGGCLPKDIRAFMARAEELGVQDAVDFLRDIDAINQRRRERVIEILENELGDLKGRTIGILGAAFKPESDDLRDSPALHIALAVKDRGATVQIHDPKAGMGVKKGYPEFVVVENGIDVFQESDAVILATEWAEYTSIEPQKALKMAKNPLIIDGRNVLDVKRWLDAGWNLYALGRSVQRKNHE